MSPRSSSKKSKAAQPAADVYVCIMFISVAALVTGCIFLALELNKYGWKFV